MCKNTDINTNVNGCNVTFVTVLWSELILERRRVMENSTHVLGNNQVKKRGRQLKKCGRSKETILYIKSHWQLYVIFLLPALLLTLVFKYLPMGGVLIAFQDYNPIKGILGSEFVGFEHFIRFMKSPDFILYLVNTLKLSIYGLLWGFPVPIILAFLLNRISSSKIRQKVQLVLYLPNFISVIVLCGIIRILLSVNGPLNLFFNTDIDFMTYAFSISYNLYCLRYLANCWMGFDYVYGCTSQCK